MASEEDRELDALLSELRATQAPSRDEASERARRRFVSRAIERRAHAYDPPRRIRKLRDRTVAVWALGGLAGALLLVAAASSFRKSETTAVEAERLEAASGSQVAPSAPASAATMRAADPARTARDEKLEPSPLLTASPAPASASRPAPSALPSATSAAIASATAADAAGASLADQNALFQSAVRAARRGDDDGALREFDLLLERFPTSPLAADSLVRKFRTLARLGRTAESAQAAREYLTRYPQGFAAAEAEKLLSTAPSQTSPGGL